MACINFMDDCYVLDRKDIEANPATASATTK